jgi:hypothetical protein
MSKRREIAYRANDGVEVALVWDPRTNELALTVSDVRTGDDFELTVGGAEALEAFAHPYAYAASGGVHFLADRRLEPAAA